MSFSPSDHSAPAAMSPAVVRPVAGLVAIPAVLIISGEVGAP